jgi:hypothetical protein
LFRRITLIVLFLSLTLSLAVIPVAAKTETLHFKFQGQFADASFGTFDETGCIETFVHVTAQDGKVKRDGKPEVESIATVHIEQVNHCTTEFIVLAFGLATLSPDEFVIDNKLNKAMLTTTIMVEEFVSGTTVPVDVTIRHAMGAFREAQASGIVTAIGINFTPDPAFEAELGDVKIGEVTISHDL